MIRCDGCDHRFPPVDIREVHADGHSARYCEPCRGIYQEWVNTCLAEENRLNRLNDLFIERTREHVTLQFVPQDLPRVSVNSDNLMRLG